jgi:hypothetical protein
MALKKEVGRQKRYPGIAPARDVLARKLGKREEDGSFRIKGGGVYDPGTGKVRARITPKKKK